MGYDVTKSYELFSTPTDEWKKNIHIAKFLKANDSTYPNKLEEYFQQFGAEYDLENIDTDALSADLMPIAPTDIKAAIKEYGEEGGYSEDEGYIIDLTKLPKYVTKIKFNVNHSC